MLLSKFNKFVTVWLSFILKHGFAFNKSNVISSPLYNLLYISNIDKLFSSTIENFRKSADTPTEIEAIQDFVDSYTNFQEKVKTKNDVTKDNTKDDRTGNITQNNKSPFAELYTNIYALKFNYINDIVSVISELFFTVYNYEEDIYDS